jgi:hypothetical protein
MELVMSKLIQGLSLATLAVLTACGSDRASAPIAPRGVAHDAAAHSAVAQSDAEGALVAEIRQATARFHRVEVALAEGYAQGSPCETSATGGMGEHFRKGSLFDGIIDPAHPEILMYEPQKNGGLRLVGVEFLIPSGAWDPTHTGPPMLGGQVFEDRRLPGSGGPPFPNYGLHVWIWEHNPNGLYTPWNPTVNCDFAP